MSNEIAISERQKALEVARERLEGVRNIPRATEREALSAAHLIIASYPGHKAANVEVYMQQIVRMLTGIPAAEVLRVANPSRGGIVAECTFLPTLAELKIWIDRATAHYRSIEQQALNEIETLAPPEPLPTPEERERRVEVSAKVSAAMRAPMVPTKEIEWLKPESQQSAAHRAETERARRVQRPDTPENRASLLNTDVMRNTRDESENAA